MTLEEVDNELSTCQQAYVGCAAVGGVSSPVVAGPRASVLNSLATWISSTPAFLDGMCTAEVSVHRASADRAGCAGSTGDTADGERSPVIQALQRAGVLLSSVVFPPCTDPTTQPAGEVARGHRAPDVIALRDWSRQILKAPRAWPVRIPETGPDGTEPGPAARRFARLSRRVRREWSSSAFPLLVNTLRTVDEIPERLTVFTDASVGPRSRYAGFGIVCPELSVIASGVLPRGWTRRCPEVSVAETAAVAAAAELFGQLAGDVVVHTDSVAAVNWWRNPAQIPDSDPEVRTGVDAAQRAVSRAGGEVRTRWVKGHADCEANLWADRAARLSWRSADWREGEAVRLAKFDRLADEFTRC